MVATTPYGAWPSPLSARDVASAAVRPTQIRVDGDDVYWLENRPDEGGRQVVVRQRADGSTEDVTPPDRNIRTRVHEYGGGDYLVSGGTVWFSDFGDQGLYRLAPASPPELVAGEEGCRYADGSLTSDGLWIVCVRECHDGGEPRNEIVAVPADGAGEVVLLATGRDFYAAPRVSPGGDRLAWLEWDHPELPWDSTELVVATLEGTEVRDRTVVAGGIGESVIQPQWGPDGTLHFISDRTGWWNIHRLGEDDPVVALDADFGVPMWVLGQDRYAILDDGRIACSWFTDGSDRLGVIERARLDPVDCDHTAIDDVRAVGERVIFTGTSPSRGTELVEIDLGTGETGIVRPAPRAPIDESSVSLPEAISFPTTDGETAHGLLYRPRNPAHRGPEDERPPLVVTVHGGPTSHVRGALSLGIQYFTTRGFAVVDLNYRGSTGYGREYRRSLYGRWGIVDVEDAIAAARHLADRGEVDGGRVAIRGGSAGGYTTLCAATFREDFACGASYFGVADVRALDEQTHKFEARYMERLIPPDEYDERSPVRHTGQLSTPLLVLQGLEDPVVPPSQAEAIVGALREKGIAHAYLAFEGEQHGFRRTESIVAAYEAELAFYGAIMGFDPPDVPPLELDGA